MNLGTGLSGFIGSHLQIKLDITDIPHQEIYKLKTLTFDKFFFLSTYGNLIDQTNTDATIKANLTDLLHILNQINFKKGFQSFVFTSSSSVTLKIQTLYSRTKKAAEQIL